MGLRVRQQCHNAVALAIALEKESAVKSVVYPGLTHHKQHQLAKTQFNGLFGGMLTIELHSKEAAFNLFISLTHQAGYTRHTIASWCDRSDPTELYILGLCNS